MRPSLVARLAAAVVASSLASSAFAQVIEFAILLKKDYYVQTSAGSSTARSTDRWEFVASTDGQNITATSPVSGVSVNVAAGSTSPNLNLGFVAQDSEWRFSQYFATQTALNSTFAAGTYQYSIPGQTSVNLGFSGDLYPNNPFVSASTGTWSGGVLQFDPSQALTLTTNDFTTNFLSGSARIGIEVKRDSFVREGDTFINNNDRSYAFTLAANTLTAGQTYTVTVEFNRFTAFVEQNSINYVATYAAVTELQLQAIPEPSTYAAVVGGLALVGVGIYRRRRQSV